LVDGNSKRIGVTRAHLEEDAGKSLHEDFQGQSGIDLNRAGIPLLEVVSEPELRSSKEAVAYLKELHTLVCYLGICDGNMQEGSFRCDANVSVRRQGAAEFGTRAEIKNVNSFRYVEKAIEYEVERQIKLIEAGGTVEQETRLYDPDKDETRSMRTKEAANDYRYFPDPDLLPLIITQAFIQEIKASLPELPQEKCKRFINQYRLSAYDAELLISTRALADYYEETVKLALEPKLAANWIMGELLAAINKANLSIVESPITAQQLAGLILRIADNTISGKIAKMIFEAMWKGEGSADEIIEKQGLKQVTDNSAIEQWADEVIQQHPDQVAAFKAGKQQLFGFFVGQLMKVSRGTANPEQVNEVLKQKLNS